MAVILLKSDERNRLEPYIGADLLARLRSARHWYTQLEEGACFLMFPLCDVRQPMGSEEVICIYCGRDFVFCGDNTRCLSLLRALPDDLEPYLRLLRFLQALTADDVDVLDKLEGSITALEDELLTARTPPTRAGARIISLRHGLLKLRRYYEQLGLLTGELPENEAVVHDPELRKHFRAMDRRADHLLASVLHLRDYITQVREAYQAQIDIEQNQIMKIFTVITAIFLPLTLIVGWYGMNFHMPEYGWKFGYLYVIFFSAAVCGLCFFFFKRKKWY